MEVQGSTSCHSSGSANHPEALNNLKRVFKTQLKNMFSREAHQECLNLNTNCCHPFPDTGAFQKGQFGEMGEFPRLKKKQKNKPPTQNTLTFRTK